MDASYLPLVAQKAREAWLRLPPQTRIWLEVNDLIQEGLEFTHRVAKPSFSAERKTKFSTYLWRLLDNFYKSLTFYFYTVKRFEGRNLHFDEVTRIERVHEDGFFDEQMAAEAFMKLYVDASTNLQWYLRQWFFNDGTRKLHMHGPKFHNACVEMRFLSEKFHFDADDFDLLQRKDLWKLQLPPNFFAKDAD